MCEINGNKQELDVKIKTGESNESFLMTMTQYSNTTGCPRFIYTTSERYI